MGALPEIQVDEEGNEGRGSYYVVIDASALPVLVKAAKARDQEVDGYLIEGILLRLSEEDSPAWADELSFDAESECCTVRAPRRVPLVNLLRRLERRLARPASLRRLLASAPE